MNLEKNFTYHEPTEKQKEAYKYMRQIAHDYADYVQSVCPQSRELSLALTKIEESVMWANASIARNTAEETPCGK